MMHAIAEELTCSQGNVTLSKFESSKRSHKGQYQTSPRFSCREHPYKVTTLYRQSMKSYHVHKVPEATSMPAQATTIPVQPKGMRGKNDNTGKVKHYLI